MKLLILLCIAVMAGVSAYAQRISVSLKKAPFSDLLYLIEQQSNYSFIYTTEQLAHLPLISVKNDSINIFSLLDRQLRNSGISYVVKDTFIILVSPNNLLFNLKGKIITEQGKGIEGITVYAVNGKMTGITNNNGSFEIKNINSLEMLQVSGAEIEPVKISVGTSTYLEIKVKELIRELDETIVLGYGSTTKRYNTGNVSRIARKELNNTSRGNLIAALEGRVPGLLITPTSGAPSSSYQMQLRGQQSLNPNPLINYRIPPLDQPLVIINGIPFAPQNNNINQLPSPASPGSLELYQNPYGGISPFSIIDPADIETVEILKDASTTSIYGSRAANGILLINTRKPSDGKFGFETTLSTGINLITGRPSMLSTDQYLRLRNAAFSADSLQPNLVEGSAAYAPDLLKFDSNSSTDWSRYFFHTAAVFSSIHTSYSGKTNRFQFLTGLGVRNENYLLKGDFFSRQFSSINQLNYNSKNKRLTVQGSACYSEGWNQSIGSPLLLQAVSLPPNYPDPYDQNGNVRWSYKETALTDNPAALLLQPYTINSRNTLFSIQFVYALSKKLMAKLNTGYNFFKAHETATIPSVSLHPVEKNEARAWFAGNFYSTRLMEPQLEYTTISGKITASILSGLTIQQNELSLKRSKGTDYAENTSNYSLTNAGETATRSIDDSYQYRSYFSRFTLQYANRYLLHLSARQEASSRFVNPGGSALFSAVGLGWIFSEESFLKKHHSFLRFGKLRFSYGKTGSDNIGYYHYLDAWSRSDSYTGNQALPAGDIRDAGFTWSVTHKMELGLELRLWDDRLGLEISKYDHRCGDQLISQFPLSQPGRSRYISNFPAVVQNTGWEITATVNSTKTSRIAWTSQLNLSFPRNRLRTFPDLEGSLYGGRYWLNQSLDADRVIHFTGIDPATGFYTVDQLQTSFVSRTPRLYGGLSGTMRYKNWKADLLFEFRVQTGVNYLRQITNYPPGFPVNQSSALSDYWSLSSGKSRFQRPALPDNPLADQAAFLFTISDAVYSNASYLQLKNLSVSYMFNENHSGKKAVNRFSVFLRLNNIFTITPFKFTDPQVQSFYSYPLSRSIAAGTTIKL